MRALQEAAIRVPEDISIIGFNDISVAKYVSPTLTTVKVHTEWMGELAVETMKELCLNPQFLEKLLSERNSFSEIQRNIHQNNSKTWRVFPSFCSFVLVFNNQENGGKQMQPKLIILRGNSGSGKTTIANALHQCLKEQSLLISQDVVRREMLRVKDETGNLSIALLKQLVAFGYQECQYVIVEGIFQKPFIIPFSGNNPSL